LTLYYCKLGRRARRHNPIIPMHTRIGYLWEKIRLRETDPSTHLESDQVIDDWLSNGFPTYECAVKYLERISRVIKEINIVKSITPQKGMS
jgi:hypothetical protein